MTSIACNATQKTSVALLATSTFVLLIFEMRHDKTVFRVIYRLYSQKKCRKSELSTAKITN